MGTQKVAMVLLVVGILLLAGYIMFQAIAGLLDMPGIPVIVKVALGLIMVSLLVIVLSLIWERVKGGDDEDVHRKY